MKINKEKYLFIILFGTLLFYSLSIFIVKTEYYIFNYKLSSFKYYDNDELYSIINEVKSLSLQWIIANMKSDGYFVYAYDPSSNTESKENNMIRQLMASRIMAELSNNNKEILDYHKRNMEYIFKYWYREDGEKGYIYYNGDARLGAAAMALRTIVYSPLYELYKEKAEKLYNAITSMQNIDGSLAPFIIEPKDDYNKDSFIAYYSGEAILSMIEYYKKVQDKNIFEKAKKSQDFYILKYVKKMKDNFNPSYIPWQTFSLSNFYHLTKDKKYAQAIFTLNDELVKIQNHSEKYDKLLGRYYNEKYLEYSSLHATADAIYTESLAYAYEIAKELNDSARINKYRIAIILGIMNLHRLQYTEKDLNEYEESPKIVGGIRISNDDERITIDTTQHTYDAITKVHEVFKKDVFVSSRKLNPSIFQK